MRTTTLLFAALASAALMGCVGMLAQGDNPAPTSTCKNNAVCRIEVSVSGCTVKIPADKQVIEMKGRNVVIIWKLDDQAVKDKFEFDKNAGVVLKSITPDPDQQFFGQMAINNNTGYLWIDRNSDWKYYQYTIDLYDTANNRHCKLDPMFANN
jgi:hypothetical protein